jgi:HD-GYP domain-containing protein (c-di-GMP phosphodiesterase class II)
VTWFFLVFPYMSLHVVTPGAVKIDARKLCKAGASASQRPAETRNQGLFSGSVAPEHHIDFHTMSGVLELSETAFTNALRVFGDYADLKSPSWLGHSAGVAALAASAASRLGLPAGEVTLVERAALVHDLGAIGVSTGVWDKPGPLSAADKERVRMHPYLTERTLARPARLAEIGVLAALHHERIDGSGYPHGVRGDDLSLPARVIAAADAYHALGEDRPHRAALSAVDAASALRNEVTAGRLDGDAVNAVLAAAGHRVRHRPALPAGLTRREAEILVLMTRGLSNKDMAERLSVSVRTVRSHVEHVYAKIGVSARGAAAMFAMRHGLLDTRIDV